MKRTISLLLPAAAVFYLAFILGTSFEVDDERYFTLVDDAMISMRYARHLAAGHGLVWNIGEEPVQGFTNLGWTLSMGLIHLLPLPASKVSLAVMLVSAAILLVNGAVVHRIAGKLSPGKKYAPTLAAVVTIFYFPLVFWSLRGMEVGLLVLLIDLALFHALDDRNPLITSLILCLAVIVRIDAVISAGLIAVYMLFKGRSAPASLPLAAVILTTLAIFAFQATYFGDMLPTTYYQKVAGYTVWDRARRGILAFNEFALRDTLPLLLVSIPGWILYKKPSARESALLLAIFLGQCAYSIHVGGDYAEPETNAANRFIAQGMPALIVLFSIVTGSLLEDVEAARPGKVLFHPRLDPALLVALMTLLVINGEPWFLYALDNAPLLKADIRRARLGVHIAANTSPQAVIAVHAAGQVPYYSGRTTIDLLGLNEPLVAKGPPNGEFYPGHNKWNYAYSIGELQPDLIADNFAPFGEYIRGNGQYRKLESDVYVRIDSLLVDVQGLSAGAK